MTLVAVRWTWISGTTQVPCEFHGVLPGTGAVPPQAIRFIYYA